MSVSIQRMSHLQAQWGTESLIYPKNPKKMFPLKYSDWTSSPKSFIFHLFIYGDNSPGLQAHWRTVSHSVAYFEVLGLYSSVFFKANCESKQGKWISIKISINNWMRYSVKFLTQTDLMHITTDFIIIVIIVIIIIVMIVCVFSATRL